MKRYLLFSYPDYEGSGGWLDFVKDFDTVEEAKGYPLESWQERFHIVDLHIGKVIEHDGLYEELVE